jgi:hypothetical protein
MDAYLIVAVIDHNNQHLLLKFYSELIKRNRVPFVFNCIKEQNFLNSSSPLLSL